MPQRFSAFCVVLTRRFLAIIIVLLSKSVVHDRDDKTPRTIRQNRRSLRENKSSITVTGDQK